MRFKVGLVMRDKRFQPLGVAPRELHQQLPRPKPGTLRIAELVPLVEEEMPPIEGTQA